MGVTKIVLNDVAKWKTVLTATTVPDNLPGTGNGPAGMLNGSLGQLEGAVRL